MKVVRCFLVLLVALQTGVAGGCAHGVTCPAGTGLRAAPHVHAHQLIDLLDTDAAEEPDHQDADHDGDAVEVAALSVSHKQSCPDVAGQPTLFSLPLQPQPVPHGGPHRLGLPPSTAGPPPQRLYLTFCSFRN
ncbi:unnamed protein product [Gemmataceae bacterium]|nr:unnamed protein product [Gemmataceae bacterium]VTT98506.1 unnamed protein product [Gemmataceae bacterium]